MVICACIKGKSVSINLFDSRIVVFMAISEMFESGESEKSHIEITFTPISFASFAISKMLFVRPVDEIANRISDCFIKEVFIFDIITSVLKKQEVFKRKNFVYPYIGVTESLKTTRLTFKSKKRVPSPKERRAIIEDSHEPISTALCGKR